MMLLAATSKVPFYIAGAVLVAWAIGVSTVGINRETFPATVGAQRAVMLVSLILAAIAIAMAIITA